MEDHTPHHLFHFIEHDFLIPAILEPGSAGRFVSGHLMGQLQAPGHGRFFEVTDCHLKSVGVLPENIQRFIPSYAVARHRSSRRSQAQALFRHHGEEPFRRSLEESLGDSF